MYDHIVVVIHPCGENQAFNVVYMSMWCF